ncbi:hypothetical protein PM082_021666 [Marasmius tenuissimus]|nr:hypothetical protein PM082_021666 [Marasmius tenuissimus]
MFSQFFRKAKHTTITSGSGSFSHVEGDQFNHSTTIVQAKEKERSELDEYFYVKRGAIFRLRNIGINQYPRSWDDGDRRRFLICEEDRVRADRQICAAELVDRPGRVFTVVEYRGPDAKKALEKDLATLMSELTANTSQMYGYNLSAIPSILLYNELVPAAQVNTGIIGKVYLHTLCSQLRCNSVGELWLDPRRGVFCRGPPGPHLGLDVWTFGNEELPLTGELAQEDILLRFLARLKSKEVDHVVVRGVAFSGARTDVMPERVPRPTIIPLLTNTPIAVTNNVLESDCSDLSFRKLLKNGLTRFTLNGGWSFWIKWNLCAAGAWIAQASRVFYARGMSLGDDLSGFKLVYPRAELKIRLSYSEIRQQSQQPIYLFIRPPPPDLNHGRTSSLHYWSFDEDGESPLSDNVCLDFGLPMALEFSRSFYSELSWSDDAYRRIHQYQLLRGFDPSTTDFAQSLGFDNYIYQPLSDSDRFAQVNQGEFYLFLLHLPFPHETLNLIPDSECEVPRSTALKPPAAGVYSAGFLSALLSPLSPTLSNDSDILTLGF